MSEDYGLVMPFICCTSVGGPYDDASFVAGARMATIDHRCESGEAVIRSFEPTPLVSQLDLVAMRHGYTVTVNEPWDEHPDEWTLIELRRRPESLPERGAAR